jgi:hypothetical protein
MPKPQSPQLASSSIMDNRIAPYEPSNRNNDIQKMTPLMFASCSVSKHETRGEQSFQKSD